MKRHSSLLGKADVFMLPGSGKKKKMIRVLVLCREAYVNSGHKENADVSMRMGLCKLVCIHRFKRN